MITSQLPNLSSISLSPVRLSNAVKFGQGDLQSIVGDRWNQPWFYRLRFQRGLKIYELGPKVKVVIDQQYILHSRKRTILLGTTRREFLFKFSRVYSSTEPTQECTIFSRAPFFSIDLS